MIKHSLLKVSLACGGIVITVLTNAQAAHAKYELIDLGGLDLVRDCRQQFFDINHKDSSMIMTDDSSIGDNYRQKPMPKATWTCFSGYGKNLRYDQKNLDRVCREQKHGQAFANLGPAYGRYDWRCLERVFKP